MSTSARALALSHVALAVKIPAGAGWMPARSNLKWTSFSAADSENCEGTGTPGSVVPLPDAPPGWPAVPLPVPPTPEVPPAPPAPPGAPLPAPPALPAPGAPPTPVAGFFGQPVRATDAANRMTTTNVVCQDRPVMRRSFSRTTGCMAASHGPPGDTSTARRRATSGPTVLGQHSNFARLSTPGL